MRKLAIVATACLGVALIGSSGVVAKKNGKSNNGKPSASKVAKKLCNVEKKAIGNKAFKGLYGKRAMRTCKRKGKKASKGIVRNAAQECRAERSDPSFPATHGGVTFTQVYGTNRNGKNAFGKCVSGKVRAEKAEKAQDIRNAARECKAERGDPGFAAAHGGQSFKQFYGSNKNKKNAFGKCVRSKARAAAAA